jgi:membrane associated rhomboid family serine protease
MLRALAREIRNYPATWLFCLIWIVVFAAMTHTQLTLGGPFPLFGWLLPGFGGGQRFGDLSLRELGHAQIWRLITCNFVHYSLAHIVLNLMAMYLLGTLVESWYGSHQLVFLYGVIGGGGNLIAELIRYGIGSNPLIHSGGGSVVILGLVGLCAVAGWRSRTRSERSMGTQMVVFLIVTAAVGILLPQYIDNWGHAGGALVGSVLGLAHQRFLNNVSKPSAWGAGVLTGLVMMACGAAQFMEARWEAAPARQEQWLNHHLHELEGTAWALENLGRTVLQGGAPTGALKLLDSLDRILDGPSRSEVRGLRPLVQIARARPLSDPERREFRDRLMRAIRQVRQEQRLDQQRLRQLRRSR